MHDPNSQSSIDRTFRALFAHHRPSIPIIPSFSTCDYSCFSADRCDVWNFGYVYHFFQPALLLNLWMCCRHARGSAKEKTKVLSVLYSSSEHFLPQYLVTSILPYSLVLIFFLSYQYVCRAQNMREFRICPYILVQFRAFSSEISRRDI